MDIIKVAATSRSTSVAGAIAGVMREQKQVDVQAIGAGAVNQAIKAVIIARGYLELDGIDIICLPSFVEIMIDGQERTAVRLGIEERSTGAGKVEPAPDEAPAPKLSAWQSESDAPALE
ncbi:MAG: stage V sporulation protein S [Chloroflexi bacterium]|nr:MAG: stage V sporulation protein S [Chloroflexota bacterium]RLC86583.1 MAG: stage V sporulation protein S [Chloroflexota bacterium]HEY74331.1 stage V sporulation protein S [Thermoflexia bacterium]